jgi:hypothetical protein
MTENVPESLRVARRRMWLLSALLAASLVAVVSLGAAMLARKRVEQPLGFAGAPGAPAAAALVPRFAAENSAIASGSDTSASSDRAVAKEQASPEASAAPSSRSAARPSGTKQKSPKKREVLPLEKRGNERYGRFD